MTTKPTYEETITHVTNLRTEQRAQGAAAAVAIGTIVQQLVADLEAIASTVAEAAPLIDDDDRTESTGGLFDAVGHIDHKQLDAHLKKFRNAVGAFGDANVMVTYYNAILKGEHKGMLPDPRIRASGR